MTSRTNMENKLITPDMTVAELLKLHPQMEDKLIEMAPVFVKLKNPVLRRTIARVTTLKQASAVGGIELGELINKLRKTAGQDKMIKEEYSGEKPETKPDWVSQNSISIEYDATIDLNNGVHPVAKVTKEINELKENESYLLITPFLPAPLIEMARNKGFATFSEERSAGQFATYISKR